MLSQLTIHNFALVEHLDIELMPGMTAITGETGAGKSIMLDALGLTLGDRADLDVIRTGADKADICASFTLADNAEAQAWLNDHDFPSSDEQCLLRRVLTRDGRSRAYINGQATTLAELKTLGEMLIDIHNQHEHQSLLKTATHQRLLDAYGGLQEFSANVTQQALAIRKLAQEISTLRQLSDANSAQLELLTFQVQELEELALHAGEFVALDAEQKQLSHAEAALSALQEIQDLCNGSEEFNLEQGMRRATTLIDAIPFSNPLLAEAAAMLNNALIQVEEASATLRHATDRIEMNPARLEEVDERLALVLKLARKHKVAPEDLHTFSSDLQEKLRGVSGADDKVAALELQLKTLQAKYQALASELSQKRTKAARQLEKAVNIQLGKLGMASARFSLDLHTDLKAPAGTNGFDAAEFLISTNPGQTPKPLVRIASGGELSRISLAIQVVTAQTSSIPTLVFDEVDVGIGGGTAKAVGELLQQLGEKGQVLCVTHQSQVAAQAHQHMLVSKSASKNSTVTSLTRLDGELRIKEIARMLGGDELTENSLAHARELVGS